jgi:hypothetical protein
MAIVFLDPVTGHFRRIQTSPTNLKRSTDLPATLLAMRGKGTDPAVGHGQSYSTVRHFTGGRSIPGVVASRW